jgi:ferredoxin
MQVTGLNIKEPLRNDNRDVMDFRCGTRGQCISCSVLSTGPINNFVLKTEEFSEDLMLPCCMQPLFIQLC